MSKSIFFFVAQNTITLLLLSLSIIVVEAGELCCFACTLFLQACFHTATTEKRANTSPQESLKETDPTLLLFYGSSAHDGEGGCLLLVSAT